nr:polysaccharide biosynthesis C-terminal domain-containing protein [uncultured Desulfobacter sp.]
MSSAKSILKNLTANWIGVGANLLVMFFLSPFIVHTLGVTEYGIWQLLTVLTGYMGILDLGVRASTGRYIMLYLGKGQQDKVDETIRTGLGLYTTLSGFIMLAGVLLGLGFPYLFPSVPFQYHGMLRILLPILAFNIWISATGVVLSSILTAYERFDVARGADLIVLTVRTIGTIVALKLDMGLVGLTAAIILSNLVGLAMNYLLASKIHNNLKIFPFILMKERVKELYSYGIGAFLIAVSVRIIGQTDLLIVGTFINVDSVAIYSIGAMVIYYSGTFTKMIDNTFFPGLQKAVAQNKQNEANYILIRQIQLSLIVGILLFIGYFSFGKSFIRLWMYEPRNFPLSSVVKAAQVMAILSCSKLLLLLGSFSRSILAATDHIGFAAKMTVLEAIVNLLLSITFVVICGWELNGVAAGTFAAHLMFQTILVPYYACRKAGIDWSRIIFLTGVKGGICGTSFFVACHYIQKFTHSRTWVEFFFQVFLAVLIYLPVAWLTLVPINDRDRLKNKVMTVLQTKN